MNDQMGMESMLPELFRQAIWLEVLQWTLYLVLIIAFCSLVFVLLDLVLLFRQECQTAQRRPVNKQYKRTRTHWPQLWLKSKSLFTKVH